jgi:transposase InsO family protein
MKTIMHEKDLVTIDQVAQFLDGTQAIAFTVLSDKDDRYQWIQRTLIRFDYDKLTRPDKGTIRQYLIKISGYSRQQLTRLINQYRNGGRLLRRQRTVNGFRRRYTNHDIQLIAHLDELHDQPNGKALKKLCERAYCLFGDLAYERLSTISVGHLYNLRKSKVYQRCRTVYTKTQSKASEIGERRKPTPQGLPGYIRIDSVHQGDLDKRKGVYHINAVDDVTQMEIVVTVERISEHYLLPALEDMFNLFPFVIKGFHSDNGSAYINKRVAQMLAKLNVEFTKSRPRHSNDNALAECKNGHIIRKQFGHGHIPQHYATQMNEFNRRYLNPHINYHRPCLFAETITDGKGKQRKIYPYENMMTPYEKLKSLPNAEHCLKPSLNFAILDKVAYEITDNDSAQRLQKARKQLFKNIHEQGWASIR